MDRCSRRAASAGKFAGVGRVAAGAAARYSGSFWLPDVGRGELDAKLEGYFRTNLDRVAKGRRNAAVVFYCLANCWMSWNAAKRAASWGYMRVYWYRDGTDGWEAAKLPLAAASPVPGFQ